MEYLLKRFEKVRLVNASLIEVLNVGEALYRSMGDLLMMDGRQDSVRQTYAFNQGMHPSGMSFLSCLAKGGRLVQLPDGTIVQPEHLDEGLHDGCGGLWGLVEGQYVVV